jgi:hypothetical protein
LFVSLSDEGANIKRFGDDFEELKRILATNTSAGLIWDSLLMPDEDTAPAFCGLTILD